jgi:hypothetical protein
VDLLANVDLKVFKEIKDLWESWVSLDLKGKREHQDLLAIKVTKVTKDLLAIKVTKVTKD